MTLFLSVSMMLLGESSKTHFARAVSTAVFNTGRFTFSWGIYILDLWHENKRLRLQNLELSDQINYSNTAIRENERLRRLLGFRQHLSMKDSVIVATIVGRDVDRIVNTLIVNVGERDGVKKNMAVVTAEGLVGKVYENYRSSSSVQILTDVNSRVSAYVENTDILGIVSWRGGTNLMMYGLLRQKIPKKGERVYTTGVGGVFPPGLLIGTVEERSDSGIELYASVYVKPAVDFSQIQEVFILKGSERSEVWDDGEGTGVFKRPETQ
ncbi:MAG: rod shape-determining protein MreC [Candidatus Latescibacteria bacterium]|nr:rod shape-determining protein MreC [Candidatus Latescibacterota bacterium]